MNHSFEVLVFLQALISSHPCLRIKSVLFRRNALAVNAIIGQCLDCLIQVGECFGQFKTIHFRHMTIGENDQRKVMRLP